MKKKKSRKSSRSIKQRNRLSFSSLPLLVIILGIVGFVFVGKVLISSFEKNSILGTTTYLAKGDDSGGSSGSGSGSSGSGSSDSSGSSGNGNSESKSSGSNDSNNGSGSSGGSSTGTQIQPTKIETKANTGTRAQTETKQDETRTEVRLSEGERIRTRVKDGETRIDITSGGIKTRLEYRDDRVIIKAEQEDGTEVELADDTLLKIDERLAASNIKVATAGVGKFVIQRGTTGAVTNFPLSIDLATNILTVNTPTGQKTVAVLPDQAVQNLIAANVVNRLGGQAVVDLATTDNLTSVSQIISLGEQNNVPIYEINGISDQRLLGFIPVAIERTVAVSAETGEVVSTQESFANRVLDLLAF